MKAFVIAQRASAARELCAGARLCADEVVLVSFNKEEVPPAAADKVLLVAVPNGSPLDDAAATVIQAFEREGVELVFAESTKQMRIIVGRLAAHAQTSVITDVISFEDGLATSMYFGGVGQKKQKAKGAAFYTIGAGCFAEAPTSGANVTEELAWVAPHKPCKLLASAPIVKSGVDLQKADVVVAAGRGFAEESDLQMARDLCNKLGAGLGCTRPLTEGVNWLPTETYIGVSGLMLSPKVYIGAGISGQMQHMVGCNRATTVFAINKDKNAPIFKQCDYGLVGDVKAVLPALVNAL